MQKFGHIYLISTAILFALSHRSEIYANPISKSRNTAIVSAVRTAQPAVVNVHVTTQVQRLRPYRLRDPFMEFFSPFHYLIPEEMEQPSTGSGIIFNKDGYILTNDHVVGGPTQNKRKITISLPEPDNRIMEAEYIASDIGSDLAILKVKAEALPVAPLGDSGDILVGEWVVAIGNPFDLGPTVSIGVVSGVRS